MKRIIIITIVIDPKEYNGEADTINGTIDIAAAMLREEIDFPKEKSITITCEQVSKRLDKILGS